MIGVTFIHHGATETQRKAKIGNCVGRARRLPRDSATEAGESTEGAFPGNDQTPRILWIQAPSPPSQTTRTENTELDGELPQSHRGTACIVASGFANFFFHHRAR